jgi:hypothetical protein
MHIALAPLCAFTCKCMCIGMCTHTHTHTHTNTYIYSLYIMTSEGKAELVLQTPACATAALHDGI